MPTRANPISRSIWRCLAAAGAIVAAATIAPLTASAGQCPANMVVPDGQGQQMSSAKAKGVTDTVLTRLDLANEPVMLKEHALRLRRLVIQPGGIVPWHSHTDRPAIITILSGTITEYRSTCKVPIVHRAGETTGRKAVVLLSADLFHDKDDAHMM